MNYHKRTESSLVTAALDWIQCQENLKRVKWVSRLNSGAFRGEKIYKNKSGEIKRYPYRARACRPGTPDIVAVLGDEAGTMLWIECKQDGVGLSNDQIKFRDMISVLKFHRYAVVRSLDDLVLVLQELLDK